MVLFRLSAVRRGGVAGGSAVASTFIGQELEELPIVHDLLSEIVDSSVNIKEDGGFVPQLKGGGTPFSLLMAALRVLALSAMPLSIRLAGSLW